MDWQAIGAVGDLVSGIGVIVTLAYLATQIRQNTRQMHRQTMNTSQDQYSAYRHAIMNSRELAHITTHGFEHPEKLDPADLERARQAMLEWIFLEFNAWDRRRSGDIRLDPEASHARHVATVSRVIATSLGRSVWSRVRATIEPDFRDSVDQILANLPPQPETH